LSDEQRGMLQDRVNKIANQFKEEVNLIRNVSDDAMQGQTFSAADALARGLIDEVADFDGAMRGASELVKMRGKRKV
jgi:ClpP class serine protease